MNAIPIKSNSLIFYNLARKLYSKVNQFAKAGNIIDSVSYFIPSVVNYSFSCELGMKYILSCYRIQYGRIHNLRDLFNKLPNIIKDYILEIVGQFMRINKEDVIHLIEKHSKDFENWRYFYENNHLETNISFLDCFSTILFSFVKKFDGDIEKTEAIIYDIRYIYKHIPSNSKT